MYEIQERRGGTRLRFSWPLWFSHTDNGELFRGQIVDLSHNVVSFIIDPTASPPVGHHLQTRFSYPIQRNQFAMNSYDHWAEVIRVDKTPSGANRIAMRLHEPMDAEVFSLAAKSA
ncbi:MAG: hypothetical protein K9M57_05295 [Phycisphaerae bacterium]|nr:hypothetical protein [Phycisphaerae bacterium]